MRSDLQLAQRILELDSGDGPLQDDLQPVYVLAVELALRIVERDRQARQIYEAADRQERQLYEASGERHLRPVPRIDMNYEPTAEDWLEAAESVLRELRDNHDIGDPDFRHWAHVTILSYFAARGEIPS